MKKIEKTMNAASLLSKALSLTSGENGHKIEEARHHIRAALESIAKHNHSQVKRGDQQVRLNDEWWGNVVAGAGKASFARIAEGNHSPEASMKRALTEIDSMIQQETNKLKELEELEQNPPVNEIETPYQVFNG
jgi:hypothetical protein